MKKLIVLLLFILFMKNVFAAIHTEYIDYYDGEDLLQGYIAYDDSNPDLKPAILIVHEWMGLNDYARMRAEMLAREGYFAFAADVYGKDNRPKNTEEAGKLSSKYKNDRDLLRKRVNAALEELKKNKLVDVNKIAAIGYCFGGTAALELARSGADVKGVVSIHGGLDSPTPEGAKNIKSRILVLHGADDPYVPAEQVNAFEKEMNDAKVNWRMISYEGAVHAFTNPSAGNDNSKGAAYNEKADKESWKDMLDFFKEIFK